MNLVLTSTIERRWEIFVLRALGSSRLEIALCFISEALAIGWMGFASGVGMGLAFWRFFDVPLIGSQFTSAPPITSTLLNNSFLIATLTTVAGTLYPAYTATQVPSLERRKDLEKVFIRGVKGVDISEALKSTLRHFSSSRSSSEVMNFRVPDAMVRNVAVEFLTFLPERGNLIEASTWDAELNVNRLVNCVLILKFDHDLPLRHIPKTLMETLDSSRRIVLIPESTFYNLARESQELIPWFLEPRVEGKPVLTSLLDVSDPNREQYHSTTH